jgi:hypothetical protein
MPTTKPQHAITQPSGFNFSGLADTVASGIDVFRDVASKITTFKFLPVPRTPQKPEPTSKQKGDPPKVISTDLNSTSILTSEALLPMPQNIETEYPKNWTGKESFLTSTGKFIENGVLSFTQDELINFGIGAANAINPKYESTISELRQQSINQKLRMIFEGIPFRTFNFAYTLQPKSRDEVDEIKRWIQRIKIASAPTLTATQRFWHWPEVFQLDLANITGGAALGDRPDFSVETADDIFFQTGPLACTNIGVNYTPQGTWSQHYDGYWTSVLVKLSFTEMQLAHRDNIETGGY